MIDYTQAYEIVVQHALTLAIEQVDLENATGRVLAQTIIADRDYPPFNRSAMDGFALAYKEINEHKNFKITHTVFAGQEYKELHEVGTCIKIMTGAAVPSGFDAVVKIEDTTVLGDQMHIVSGTVIKNGMNIAAQGQDFLAEQVIFNTSEKLTPSIISTLASLGYHKVNVLKPPTVSIISTGNELVQVGDPVEATQIRDSNSFSVAAFLENFKIAATYKFIVKDDKRHLSAAIKNSLCSDIIFISGGVSMGDADYIPEILADLGVEKIFHKVAIKPGKPIWFGKASSGSIVFALPGNPVSVQVALVIFAAPFLRASFNLNPELVWNLPLRKPRIKKAKLDEFFPCRLVQSESGMKITFDSFNGSGDISAMNFSDGIALHPSNESNLEENTLVKFFPHASLF